MPSYVPAKRATAFIFYAGLASQASPGTFQSNPTIAAGDFKVSIDGGALANLATLPAVTPASSKMVKFSLSTSEMTGDNITIVGSDASGSEWCDVIMNIQTTARQIDDLAYPATSGRSMVVDASGLVDANTVKIGPSGSGTAQTARDVGASVLLSSGTGTGQVKLSAGYVAPNWGDVGNPTTSVALTGTTIASTQKVDIDTIKTNPVVNGGTITFPTNSTLASTTNITAGTIATVTNLTNAPTNGDLTATMKASVTTAATAATPIAASVSGNVDGSVGSVVGLTASNLDVAVSSRMATYTQPTGFLAATFPAGTIANTTNITAGTITTVTNLTNAPTAGDFTATMKTSLNAATPSVTVSDKTGFSLSAAGIQAIWDVLTSALTTVGSVGKLLVDNVNATISSRLPTASYVAPLDAAATRSAVGLASANLDTQLSTIDTVVDAVKAKTDSLTFTVAGQVDANAESMNATQINGTGVAGDLWRGA